MTDKEKLMQFEVIATQKALTALMIDLLTDSEAEASELLKEYETEIIRHINRSARLHSLTANEATNIHSLTSLAVQKASSILILNKLAAKHTNPNRAKDIILKFQQKTKGLLNEIINESIIP